MAFRSASRAPTIPVFSRWRIRDGIYVNDTHFVSEVLEAADSIDVIVWTANAELVNRLPVRRLLVGQLHGEVKRKSVQIRKAGNVHTKLYLVDGEVYLGSMNLVLPGTWHNVMIRVRGERAKSLKLYFDRLWSLAGRGQ